MKCPKCGYVSFDSNLECPKCSSGLSVEQSKLNLPSFKPSPPFLLGAIVGNEDHPIESYLGESTGVGGDDSAKGTGNAAASIGTEEDIIIEEGVGYEATEEIQNPSDFPSPPPHFRRQMEEIKELISELMPEKSKTELDEKTDDVVAEHDFSISRGVKEFGVRDQSPEDELVEGLEDLELDLEGVDLEGFAGSRETQKTKRQLEGSEKVTREVDRKKLEAEEE